MATKRAAKKAARSKTPDPEPEAAPPAVVDDEAGVQLPAKAEPTLGPPPRGLEDLDQGDMVIPRFAIVQPSSEEGDEGMIRDAISGEEHDALNGVVLLKVRKGRVYFLKPEDGGGVACASDDRIVPADRIEAPEQDECAGCPKARWTTNPKSNKRMHPDCQETYTLLIAHDGMPYFMTFKSAAMKDVKKLLTQLRLKAGKHKVDAFGFEFSIGTEEVKFDVGRAFMPRFTKLKRVSDEDYELYSAMFDSFAMQQPTFDDKPESDDEDGEGQGDFPFGDNEQ